MQDLRVSQKLFNSLSGSIDPAVRFVFDQLQDLVTITDESGKLIYINPKFSECTGYAEHEVLGGRPSILKSGMQDDQFYKNMWEIISKGKEFQEVFINRKKDQSIFFEEKTISPIIDPESNKITHYVSIGKDISSELKTENRMQYYARNEPITNLPNRVEFLKAVEALTENKKSKFAVIYIDVDSFGKVNTYFDYQGGDSILKEISNRLAEKTRNQDLLACFGGDSFAYLYRDLKDLDCLVKHVDKIVNAFEHDFELDGKHIRLSASIGISLFPEDEILASKLINNAQLAMKIVKNKASEHVSFFTEQHNEKNQKLVEYEADIKHAFDNDEFVMYYQPKFEIESGDIVGFEALIRWQHKEKGIVPPGEFLSIIEQSDLSTRLTEWSLEHVCKQINQWKKLHNTNCKVAINLSASQLLCTNIVSDFIGYIKKYNISMKDIEIEVTENDIVNDYDMALNVLKLLDDVGIKVAIDDFGVGYSSLSYLKYLPVSYLKIDKRFIDGVHIDKIDAEIVKAILGMCKSLNILTIAEGVEYKEQYQYLKNMGCDCIQGYLLAKPMPESEAIRLYLNNK